MSCKACVCRSNCPEVSTCPHKAVSNRLEELTGNNALVTFSPLTCLADDRGAEGHLYLCSARADNDDDDSGYIDDRGPEPLEVQLVRQLRRIAAFTNRIADETEAKIGLAIA